MRLDYTLTLDDYRAAFRLHRRQKLFRRLYPWLGPILLAVAAAGFVTFSILGNLQLVGDSFALAAGALVMTIGVPVVRYFNVRASFRRLFPPGHSDRTSAITIDEKCVTRELSGVAELKMLWNGIYAFAQNDRITLLYTNKTCFLLFPTKIMNEEQRSELAALVARHVKRRYAC
jgi:hypothetical protein